MFLCVTHSSRPVDYNRCSPDFLTRRYASPDRLQNLPAFEELDEFRSNTYTGNITLWECKDIAREAPSFLMFIEGDYKAQHAIVKDGQLIVCGLTFLEVVDLRTRESRRISDPWFQDGHTVFPGSNGEVVVSCASSDSVLVFDLESGSLRKRLRVPEDLYGFNYTFNSETDVRQHHIPNDYQLAHPNCAYPFNDGFLVSGLIHGSIGLFEKDGCYREITRGYIGCHGVRTRSDLDGVYFADSCNGSLVEMDWEGRIMRKFTVDSLWLHDVQWIGDNFYLFALSDRNRLELWDISSRTLIWQLDMQKFGTAVQFLSSANL